MSKTIQVLSKEDSSIGVIEQSELVKLRVKFGNLLQAEFITNRDFYAIYGIATKPKLAIDRKLFTELESILDTKISISTWKYLLFEQGGFHKITPLVLINTKQFKGKCFLLAPLEGALTEWDCKCEKCTIFLNEEIESTLKTIKNKYPI